MAKPKRYYVEYEDSALAVRVRQREAEGKHFDLSDMLAEWGEYDTIEDAESAMRLAVSEHNGYACVYERQNLRDETEPGLPSWTFWDSDDEIVKES